jgi:DNA replication protein DnaC
MNESSREDILTLIKSLKLTGMMEAYDDIIADTLKRKGTHSDCLHQLLKAEMKARTLKALQARIRSANFPAMKDWIILFSRTHPSNQNRSYNSIQQNLLEPLAIYSW